MNRFFLFTACFMFVPLQVRAEASNYCLWMILVDTHAAAVRCGKPLDGPAEQRYRQLRDTAEAEIIRDASLGRGMSAEKAQSVMTNYIAHSMVAGAALPGYCTSKDAPGFQKMLEEFTTAENTAKILAGLKARKDPFDGECL